jgi:hypothetical protein
MALYDRLAADDATNISVQGMVAVLRQIGRGLMTEKEAHDALGLTADEQVEFSDLLATGAAKWDPNFVWDVLYLCKRKTAGYTSGAELEAKLKV